MTRARVPLLILLLVALAACSSSSKTRTVFEPTPTTNYYRGVAVNPPANFGNVHFTTPANGSHVGATVRVTVSAPGASSILFYVDRTPHQQQRGPRWTATVGLTPGRHVLAAVPNDKGGQPIGQATIVVTR